MKKRKLLISIIAGILVGAMFLSLLVSLFAGNAAATNPSSGELKEQLEELEAEKDGISQKLEELERQQQANYSDMESLIAQKGIIDQQVALLYAQIANVNSQIATYSLMIADKQAELDDAEARLEELRRLNRERIRAMEEEGDLSLWSVIFEANSFAELLDRIDMVAEITKADRERIHKLSEAAEEVQAARDELAAEKAALEETRAELEAAQEVLAEKNAEADRLLAELVEASEDLEALHNQFEKEEEDFLNQIAQKEQEYYEQLEKEEESSRQASIQLSIQASIEESRYQDWLEESRHQATATKPTSKPSTGNPGYGPSDNPSGVMWLVPCEYVRLSSPFGYRWHPTTGQWSMHNGVDFAAPKGTPIYATRSGTVTIATYSSTAGNYVSINHLDGYSSVYMHMTHYVVEVGQSVTAGQLIGYVGSTGRSTGPHLHFGISYKGTYVNPMDYVG